MIGVSNRPSAYVDADDIGRLVAAYADAGHDVLLRAGCLPEQAAGLLLAGIQRLVAALADDPAEVGDLLGYWLRMTAGRGAQAGPAHQNSDGRTRPVRDPVDAQAEDALRALDWDTIRLLLLRDVHNLPLGSVAVATGTDLPELHRRTGTARMAFLREYASAAVQLLAELPTCAADLGGLAALCDATAPPALGAELRRHAYRCQRCEETAELQRRARRILGRLSLHPMEPPARTALVAAAVRLAESRLPMLDVLLDGKGDGQPDGEPDGATVAVPRGRGARRPTSRPALGRRVIGAALGAALVTGLLTGAAIGLGQLGASDGDRDRSVTVQRDPRATTPVRTPVHPAPSPR